ncbi:dimethylsulfonioproprionate lyase family protein [Luteolibacter sp. GHJ8]|uniref:Dimethylsulfonioproprionate lyase family protein n=1 Tax=Luteolibacter rhizosphaerae TaxID=2989719 RepID=A0ABT3G2V1_9BACT|nr:dimethylsulfonioproprionate lyase family protein [Luteolibacter rhizosphaerae]MCW1914173.1 dimethylsulfonioproprionate lyase family protein [Luteolibacter rhizosphaerae]
MSALTAPSIVMPGAAKTHVAFGDQATFLLTGEQTGGRYTMFRYVVSPGGGPPLHRHDDEDEWFLVLEGSGEFYGDGKWTMVPEGGSVFMPRGSVHSFRNPGHSPLVLLIHTSPSGFETFFARCGEEFAKESGPDMDAILAIAAEHGIAFEGP